jgi:hypothetical protein
VVAGREDAHLGWSVGGWPLASSIVRCCPAPRSPCPERWGRPAPNNFKPDHPLASKVTRKKLHAKAGVSLPNRDSGIRALQMTGAAASATATSSCRGACSGRWRRSTAV